MYIGTSWKMHKTRPEAADWTVQVCKALPPQLGETDHVFVMPPYTAIATVREAAAGSPLWVGAQNVHEQEQGAFTGDVSAAMLAELGCDLVEIGHTERRNYHHETNAMIAGKARRVLDYGMRPLLCVGEPAKVHESGNQIDYVLNQADAVLGDLDADEQALSLLAYEPAWAIGQGSLAAKPEDIAPVHKALRDSYPRTPVLYGGSVNEGNAAQLAAIDAVDGLFIGRAALSASGFLAVLEAALATMH